MANSDGKTNWHVVHLPFVAPAFPSKAMARRMLWVPLTATYFTMKNRVWKWALPNCASHQSNLSSASKLMDDTNLELSDVTAWAFLPSAQSRHAIAWHPCPSTIGSDRSAGL